MSVRMKPSVPSSEPREPAPVAEPSRRLQPPRFGLRALFWTVGLIAAELAIWQGFGPIVGLTVLLGLCVVLAHVAGNAIGSRLRDGHPSSGARAAGSPPGPSGAPTRSGRVEPHHYAPPTRLSQRTSLGWFLPVATTVGALTGAALGGFFVWRSPQPSIGLEAILLGGLATGALSGFFTFWTFSLLQVFLGAWWEAHRHGHERR